MGDCVASHELIRCIKYQSIAVKMFCEIGKLYQNVVKGEEPRLVGTALTLPARPCFGSGRVLHPSVIKVLIICAYFLRQKKTSVSV